MTRSTPTPIKQARRLLKAWGERVRDPWRDLQAYPSVSPVENVCRMLRDGSTGPTRQSGEIIPRGMLERPAWFRVIDDEIHSMPLSQRSALRDRYVLRTEAQAAAVARAEAWIAKMLSG